MNKKGVAHIALLGVGIGLVICGAILTEAGKMGDSGEWANEASREYHKSRIAEAAPIGNGGNFRGGNSR